MADLESVRLAYEAFSRACDEVSKAMEEAVANSEQLSVAVREFIAALQQLAEVA